MARTKAELKAAISTVSDFDANVEKLRVLEEIRDLLVQIRDKP